MRNIRGFLFLIVLYLLLSSCTQRQLSVRDLETFPQQASTYFVEERLILTPEKQKKLATEYLTFYFSPWNGDIPPVEKKRLAARYNNILKNKGLGENLLPLSADFLQGLIDNADLAHYPAENIYGITTRAVHLRTLPTNKPRFLEKCGPDGYPFDLFQESLLSPGTPLVLRHKTRDRKWVYVQAGFVSGWMETKEFAQVDKQFIDHFIRKPKIVLTRDHGPLISEHGEFMAEGRIGMILPARDGQVLFPVGDAKGTRLEVIQLSSTSFAGFPLAMTRSAAAAVIDELKGQPYGWGGLYENRDCSSLLRDYFTVFGVWLPRNSFAQVQSGNVRDISKLGVDARKKLLMEEGIPFIHLVGQKGHVTLYVGTHEGEPVLFHAIWGISIKKSGKDSSRRIIIGRSAFTGPSPGYENPEARKAGKSLLGMLDFLTDPTWRKEELEP